METKYWVISKDDNPAGHPALKEAARLIRSGEVVAFPTETVYGLGGNALSDEAVAKIFAAKGRPSDNPLIIHIPHWRQALEIVEEIPETAAQLFAAFTPGPLTLILKGNGKISRLATAGLETVALRIPSHPVAAQFLRECGVPLAAPSANLSGRPSPTRAEHVREDLSGRIAGIIDGGPAGIGVESTVLDCTITPPVILRPGGIPKEAIEAVIGPVRIDPALAGERTAPKSPGMKYTHYAPKAPLWIAGGDTPQEQRSRILRAALRLFHEGKRVGILTTVEGEPYYREALPQDGPFLILACGSRSDLFSVARTLYDALRSFDHCRAEVILSEAFPPTGVGEAVMNRLRKASGGRILAE